LLFHVQLLLVLLFSFVPNEFEGVLEANKEETADPKPGLLALSLSPGSLPA
jgi:hypothetical protein